MKPLKLLLFSSLVSLAVIVFSYCKSPERQLSGSLERGNELLMITANPDGKGIPMEIEFEKGKAHNHPTFAIWLEDREGAYLQTLFVTRAIGQGEFTYGDKSGNRWKPGEVRRPAALPVWSHKRGIKAADGLFVPDASTRVPDAYSGATPPGSFILRTRTESANLRQVKLFLELNQTWDWNEYWNNNKFPDDLNYKTSSQPSLVYEAEIDLTKPGTEYLLSPIGHGHYSGSDGTINPDLSTLTTALKIAGSIRVRVINP